MTFDHTSLKVQIKAIPYVGDPATLLDPAAETNYENQQATLILAFQIKAQ